ncbi:MAG: cytochrome c biogenesis protein CcdA [Clostridiales bacterium]|nr:cytochrome c biogenesis protein CcdA [Clostridiales bacterium]
MIDAWLESLSVVISNNFWISPIIALVAGVLISVTPCSLSTIPLVIGYVGGTSAEPQKAFKLSLAFALGSAITFTILGTIAALVGGLIGSASKWWYIALGILMILMALQILEVYEFIPSTYLTSKTTKKGYIGAIIAGILAGVFASPCATPVLVVLLAIVASKGSIVWGILLLLLYAIGNSFFIVVAGTSVGTVRKFIQSEKYGKFSIVLKYILGIVIIFIGIYMFYLGF